jgi:hypothetical protein
MFVSGVRICTCLVGRDGGIVARQCDEEQQRGEIVILTSYSLPQFDVVGQSSQVMDDNGKQQSI